MADSKAKTSFEVVDVKESKQFAELERVDAMTFEGVIAEDDSFEAIIEFLKEYNAIPEDRKLVKFWVIRGDKMNKHYKLTGDNAYPDNLTIINIPLEQLKSISGVALPMRRYNGRWYSDVVSNNERRERAKRR